MKAAFISKEKVLEGFDSLAAKSHCSRNELMCMALHALDHLEFIPESGEANGLE